MRLYAGDIVMRLIESNKNDCRLDPSITLHKMWAHGWGWVFRFSFFVFPPHNSTEMKDDFGVLYKMKRLAKRNAWRKENYIIHIA